MRNTPQGERVEVMLSPVCGGGAWEECGEFLMDGGGQTVALKRLYESHADNALILAGHDPQRIGIGAGTDTHGLHLLCYGIAALGFAALLVKEVEMPSIGYAVGTES